MRVKHKEKFLLGYRKLKLQYKVVKHLKNGKNDIRYKEQKKVLRLLFNPKVLFNDTRLDYETSKYDYLTTKTFNVLTSNCSSNKLYELTTKRLEETDS